MSRASLACSVARWTAALSAEERVLLAGTRFSRSSNCPDSLLSSAACPLSLASRPALSATRERDSKTSSTAPNPAYACDPALPRPAVAGNPRNAAFLGAFASAGLDPRRLR
jgi:hypothetical protein